ncbi:MAG TPA: GNAT family N-acetyltransferase [Dysgonomonas sp.]|nr:GNAT family N-acetyltransferase [Dysgonomonas sp.]
MSVNIRIATEEDLRTVFSLVKEFADYLGTSAKVKTSFADFIRSKDIFYCLLAETKDKEIAGYALFSYTFHTWTGKAVYLDDLYVREEYRRSSVGTQLINAVVSHAKQNKCKSINWEIPNWNKEAIAFYKKMGINVGDDNLNCTYIIR